MDGYSKFYDGLLKAPKNNQFPQIRKYFISLVKIFTPLGELYGKYRKYKLGNAFEEEKKNLEPKIKQLEKDIKELEDLSEESSRMKYHIIRYWPKIISNPNLTLPYRIEEFKEIKHPGRKTTTCSICLCNCHLDCQDKFLRFCKAFNFIFNCKVCPNKCGASAHTFPSFDYPKCNYKTINEIVHNSEIEIEEKLKKARDYYRDESHEYLDKSNNLKKELNKTKKLVESKESCLKLLSKKLDDEVYNFRFKYLNNFEICESFDVEIFGLFIFSFLQPYY